MRGHIRRRGEHSFEYIVDIGTASAQRCQSCRRRFWVERKPKECCPRCGGAACRDRGAPPRDQGRLRHAQGVRGGPRQGPGCRGGAELHAADQGHGQGVPAHRVAAHGQGQPATDHLRQLRDAHPRAHHPAPGQPCSCRSSPQRRSTPSTPTSQNTVASTAAGRSRPPRCAACTPSCTGPVTTPCAGDA